MRVAVFSEAAADFRTATDLIDRVVRAGCPGWVGDLLDTRAGGSVPGIAILTHWRFSTSTMSPIPAASGVRARHGHFDGAPNMPGALMATSVFLIVRAPAGRASLVGVVLLWDPTSTG
jgi:hypothetical protein